MRMLQRLGGLIASRFLVIYASLALLYLMLPIITIALFSFNDPRHLRWPRTCVSNATDLDGCTF